MVLFHDRKEAGRALAKELKIYQYQNDVIILGIAREIEKEKHLIQQRIALYRQHKPLPDIRGKIIILVDDGVATGETMLTVIEAMRKAEAKRIVVAVPVSSTEAYQLLLTYADEVICLHVREDFIGVGMYFLHFDQITDQEVVHFLREGS